MRNTPPNPDYFDAHARPECLQCQLSQTDALDGLLSPAEWKLFQLHLAGCADCAQLFADTQRGHASLEMLKSPRPEPRPELLRSILAQTSGEQPLALTPALTTGSPAGFAPESGRLLAFPPPARAVRRLRDVLREPRLAMTAAMAFFSITLTMSLTGVRLDQLHASDLSPSGLRRGAYGLEAGAVRYYDNLRVVHVLTSHVDTLREDLQQRQEPVQAAPAAPSAAPAAPAKPPSAGIGGQSSSSPERTKPRAVPTLVAGRFPSGSPVRNSSGGRA